MKPLSSTSENAPPVGLADAAAVVGVGETDYAVDYKRAKERVQYSDAYGYGAGAFKRALDDAGLRRDDIDGLVVGPTTAYERTAEILGLDVRWASQADAGNAVLQATMAIASGLAETVALVYGNDQRTAGVAYGGHSSRGTSFLSYVYYAPWGFTSQGALYAMMANRYMAMYGLTEEELGEVAVAQRRFALENPNAIMRKPLSIADYLAARYIAEPLRLFDYCLVNDGGVALILTTRERAERSGRRHVRIAGVGSADMNVDATSLRPRLQEFYRPAHRRAAATVYDMAGLTQSDIDCVQIYDSFSCHVVFALEGFGFVPEGEAGKLLAGGGIGPGGKLPVNTSGGHLSESYMQGWNHQVEAVRQILGRGGGRQVEDCRHVQYISDVAGKVVSIIYAGGA